MNWNSKHSVPAEPEQNQLTPQAAAAEEASQNEIAEEPAFPEEQEAAKPRSRVATVLFAVQLAVMACLLLQILLLNLLPLKFAAILAVVLALPVLVCGWLLLPQDRGTATRVLGGLLAVLITVGGLLGNSVVWEAGRAMKSVSGATYMEESNYVALVNVYVRKDDPAALLADLKNDPIAALEEFHRVYTDAAMASLSAELGAELTLTTMSEPGILGDALLDGEVRAVMLDANYADLLEETGTMNLFFEGSRLLGEIAVEVPRQSESNFEVPIGPSTEERAGQKKWNTEPDITKDTFAMYLSGSDTRSAVLDRARSDVNILAIVNPKAHQVLLINTPRDYYVPNPAGDGALDKLTHCGLYGTQCSMVALGTLYDLWVPYYAQINFNGMERLVDAIGGVEVYSDAEFSVGTYSFHEGYNTMNGNKALAFARDRYNQLTGDNARGRHQMAVLQGILDKLTTSPAVLANYTGILNSLRGMFVTSMTSEEIASLVKLQLNDMSGWDVKSVAATGYDSRNTTYSMPGYEAYVMVPNEDSVARIQALINKMFAGETLTNMDLLG